jgi:hypothetical protein
MGSDSAREWNGHLPRGLGSLLPNCCSDLELVGCDRARLYAPKVPLFAPQALIDGVQKNMTPLRADSHLAGRESAARRIAPRPGHLHLHLGCFESE